MATVSHLIRDVSLGWVIFFGFNETTIGILWGGQFDIPTSHFSERFSFRTVFIPKGFYSERSFLRTVFSPLIRKAYNPKGHCSEILILKCHCSERFLIRKVFIPNGFYPERYLIRTVFVTRGRFSEIRNLIRTVLVTRGRFSEILIRKVFDTKSFIPNGFYPERYLIRTVLVTRGRFSEIRYLIRTVLVTRGRFSEIRNKNLSDQKLVRIKKL